MIKAIYFSTLIFALSIFSSCSSSERPGEAAKKYAEYMAFGEYEKFIDAIAFEENTPKEQLEERKEILLDLLEDIREKDAQEKGKIDKIELLSEIIGPDGNSAKVMLKQTYSSGESEEANFYLVKINKTWKITLDQ